MSTKLGIVIADFTTQLATAMAVGATTATLQSATDDDGNTLPAGTYFFAIDGNNSQKEHIVCTLSGTSLTAIKTITRQGVQTSGSARSHRVGATITLTDFATLRYINDLLTAATDLDSSTPLKYDGTASITNANHLATKAYVDGVSIAGAPNASDSVKGIVKLTVAPASPTNPLAVGDNDPRVPTSAQIAAMAGTSGSTPGSGDKFVDNTDTSATGSGSKVPRGTSGKLDNSWLNFKFGGTGVDGALAIASGTTTIDLGGASVVVKNYTSIAITGTGVLAFTNAAAGGTLIILKSQGNVTLTSSATPMIDASGLGGAGGNGGSCTNNTQGGSSGTAGASKCLAASNAGAGAAGGAIGSAGAITTTLSLVSIANPDVLKYPNAFVGGGGGGAMCGASNPGVSAGGAGGKGGGALIIECAGAWNFTTTSGISVAGKNGANGTVTSGTNETSAGGGGGAGGYFLALYNTLTASSGTVTSAGGAGGTNGGGGVTAYGGGGGGNPLAAGSDGSSSASGGATTGGAGANGFSLIALNNTTF